MRCALIVVVAALCGCAAPQPVVEEPEPQPVRFVEVHSVPAGWVELDENYEGPTPRAIRIETRSDGHPIVPHALTVRDASGAWDRRMLMPQHEVPRVMVYDMRDISGLRTGISMAR